MTIFAGRFNIKIAAMEQAIVLIRADIFRMNPGLSMT
jgi:hypothetical protein